LPTATDTSGETFGSPSIDYSEIFAEFAPFHQMSLYFCNHHQFDHFARFMDKPYVAIHKRGRHYRLDQQCIRNPAPILTVDGAALRAGRRQQVQEI
jgi:hypothetical protein